MYLYLQVNFVCYANTYIKFSISFSFISSFQINQTNKQKEIENILETTKAQSTENAFNIRVIDKSFITWPCGAHVSAIINSQTTTID